MLGRRLTARAQQAVYPHRWTCISGAQVPYFGAGRKLTYTESRILSFGQPSAAASYLGAGRKLTYMESRILSLGVWAPDSPPAYVACSPSTSPLDRISGAQFPYSGAGRKLTYTESSILSFGVWDSSHQRLFIYAFLFVIIEHDSLTLEHRVGPRGAQHPYLVLGAN
ncbi:hypothetical protein D9611_001479 [Ephemerocybe angulata]|uniref:Uncharacterized protein n=1 Tax=Ephemerocybe angulata TaxID=980116 RepID=A0A8H5CIK8_9AGAR|nr:hypothetical protein D9611_001479 [Tulosesus angulatus]